MDSKIILGRILQKFIDKGYSKYQDYNKFGYISHTDNAVKVAREDGKDTPIPFSKLLISIDAYKENSELYNEGTTALRAVGIIHITSPVHSLLHLLQKDDYK